MYSVAYKHSLNILKHQPVPYPKQSREAQHKKIQQGIFMYLLKP